MIATVLALAAGIAWGVTDYLGGHATRWHLQVFMVVTVSAALGLVLLVPALLIHGVPLPHDPKLLFAVVAGVAVTIELSLLYPAIARGQVFVAAPVGAIGTSIPVVIGLLSGDTLNVVIAVGLVCAIAGTGVSSWSPSPRPRIDSPASTSGASGAARASGAHTALLCLAAGTAVGVALTCLHLGAEADPYWTTTIAQVTIASCAAVPVVAGLRSRAGVSSSLSDRVQVRGLREAWRVLSVIALAGAGGDLLYTIASGIGQLSVVAAIASLYPVVTVILAVAVGHRPRRNEVLGVALALLGAVLLAASGA